MKDFQLLYFCKYLHKHALLLELEQTKQNLHFWGEKPPPRGSPHSERDYTTAGQQAYMCDRSGRQTA